MTVEHKSPPRSLTEQELAGLIRMFRGMHQWSQEVLAGVSGLSVRTIQRVERGEPSDLDTRRALARAFDIEDIDIFSKPYNIPSPDELKAQQEAFEREHLVLDATKATTGAELARLFENSTMDVTNTTMQLKREAAEMFAGLLDYLRDYRDCASKYGEVEKFPVFDELQKYVDDLSRLGISLCYATRKTKLVGRDWENKTPLDVTIAYLSPFQKGAEPAKIAVTKALNWG